MEPGVRKLHPAGRRPVPWNPSRGMARSFATQGVQGLRIGRFRPARPLGPTETNSINMTPRILLGLALAAWPLAHGVTVTFEDLTPTTPYAGGGTYENGENLSGSFTSGPLTLPNGFVDAGSYTYWNDWSYSTTTDTTTPGYENQYSAFPGSGADGSLTYAIAATATNIPIPSGFEIVSLQVTNSTYAALSMRDGDAFAKKFGGVDGNDPDLFQVVFTGFNGTTNLGSVSVALADFTFGDNGLDYILDNWLEVDLSSLSAADRLEVSFTSTDTAPWGLNTPTYVAIDNVVLNAVPEPSTLVLTLVAPLALLRRRR